jgi:hypothetical protein
MLLSLNRQKFEQLIPVVATGAQYLYCWGKIPDFLRRMLISVSSVMVILLIASIYRVEELQAVKFFVGLIAGLYWLWGPVFWASSRNVTYRRYRYAGFFRGEVLDVYITEELIGQEENVNARGDLVIVENRERKLNLEVGDETGFTTRIQVPLKREHQGISLGDRAEMIVLSNRDDMGKIAQVSDVYVPRSNVWVSDYPYLRRDEFELVSGQIDRRFARPPLNEDYDDRNYDDRNYDNLDPEEPRRRPSRSKGQYDRNDYDRNDYGQADYDNGRSAPRRRSTSNRSSQRRSRSTRRQPPRTDGW